MFFWGFRYRRFQKWHQFSCPTKKPTIFQKPVYRFFIFSWLFMVFYDRKHLHKASQANLKPTVTPLKRCYLLSLLLAQSNYQTKSKLEVLENLHFDFRSHSLRSDFFHLTRFDTFRLGVLHRWRAREGHVPIVLISFVLWVDSNLYNVLDPQWEVIVAWCVAERLDRIFSFLSIQWLVWSSKWSVLRFERNLETQNRNEVFSRWIVFGVKQG